VFVLIKTMLFLTTLSGLVIRIFITTRRTSSPELEPSWWKYVECYNQVLNLIFNYLDSLDKNGGGIFDIIGVIWRLRPGPTLALFFLFDFSRDIHNQFFLSKLWKLEKLENFVPEGLPFNVVLLETGVENSSCFDKNLFFSTSFSVCVGLSWRIPV